MSIEVRGKLTITSIDAKTGKILDIDTGENLVLRTGSASLGYLLTGFTVLPVGERVAFEGQVLRDFIGPVSNIVKYVQFGTRSTPVTYYDLPPYDNGTLDPNAVDPSGASPIVEITKSNVAIGNDGTVTFTCTLEEDQGNKTTGDVTYTEAILMGMSQTNPLKYNWFARRVFPGRVKNSSIALQAQWSIYFYVKESIS